MEKENSTIEWSEILKSAVNEPGKILEAYSTFHNYSIGNQMAAIWQCAARKIPIGPIASFNRWKELGRSVKKGSKAIELCQPFTIKDKEDESRMITVYSWKKKWFVLSQTEGADLPDDAFVTPVWEKDRAIAALNIEMVPFAFADGNVQGYASMNKVAINPLAQFPLKTLFHELGHVMLGHTGLLVNDTETLPRSLREVEAESVALICLSALNLPGIEYCRGYIQNWYGTDSIPEKNAQRIFGAADKILKAGRNE